jgi:hypothetical protein
MERIAYACEKCETLKFSKKTLKERHLSLGVSMNEKIILRWFEDSDIEVCALDLSASALSQWSLLVNTIMT